MAGLAGWMSSACPPDPSPPVTLRPAPIGKRGGGYGMVTTKPIKKGDKMVNVPRKLWMTSQTARESPVCCTNIKKHNMDAWKSMCLHVLCERSLGSESFWKSYIEHLPNQAEHPLLWTREQLDWLKGSPMSAKLESRFQQIRQDTDALIVSGGNEIVFARQREEPLITPASMNWVAATLLSRAFNMDIPIQDLNGASKYNLDIVEVEAERILALVPWADSLNHCSTATERSVLQYDQEIDAAVLFAHRDYQEGEEVFESYGTWLTPSELLLDYGFVDENSKNFAITVPAQSITREAHGMNHSLLKALKKSFDGSPELRLTETGMDDTLLSYIRCAVAPKEHLISAGWTPDWTPDSANPNLPIDTMSKLVDPIDFNTEAKVLETLSEWCDKQLNAYPSAVNHDLEELQDETTGWLRQQVLRALVSEKQTVMGLQRQIRDRMQQLKEGCPLETLYV